MMKFNLKKLLRYPTIFLTFIFSIIKLNIYFISFLFPRSNKKFIFGCYNSAFADNSKYLYLYLCFYQKNISCYWITRDKKLVNFLKKNGYKSYYKYNLMGIYHSLTAKFWFFSAGASDMCFCLRGRSIKTNLWHGIPMKNIGVDLEKKLIDAKCIGPFKKLKKIYYKVIDPSSLSECNWVLTTSDCIVKSFVEFFSVKKNQCINFSYPRNFVINNTPEWLELKLLSPLKQIKDIIDQSSSVYTYMPTFRDNHKNYITNLITDNIDKFAELDAINKKLNRILLIKTHSCLEEKINLTFDTIILIDPNLDIYPLFPQINVLITDYSSVYYDFMLTNKPTIFFIPDYEYYKSQCRHFIRPYFENIDGYICNTFDDLIEVYKKVHVLLSITKKTAELKNKFWGNVDLVNDTPLDIINFVVNNS